MDTQNLENLKKIAKIFQPENIISSAEIDQVLKGIMEILASYKKGTDAINEDTKAVVNSLLEQTIKYNQQTISDFKSEAEKTHAERMKELQTFLSEVKTTLGDMEVMMSEVKNGKDADEEKIVEDVIARIRIPDPINPILDTPVTLRDKLASLKDEERLDKSAIKGLDKIVSRMDLDNVIATLQHQASFLINRGGVKSIVAGTNITVDNTDPSNPVVSSTGGGGGSSLTIGTTTITGGTDTRVLYNNAGVLDEYLTTGSGTTLVKSTAPTFVTSITTPSVLATANDSGALGASGTAFSDLFLASGGVINWNAGNVLLTHSAGILTLTGGLVGNITSGSSNWAGIFNHTGGTVSRNGLKVTTSGTSSTSQAFKVETGTIANAMTITGAGNVGIGTATPSDILHVFSALTDNPLILENSTSNGVNIKFANSVTGSGDTQGLEVGIDAAEEGRIWHYRTEDIYIGTNNAEVARFTSNGKLGLGVVSPTAVFHIKAGTASANTAPIKLTSGTVNTTPEEGTIEFDGTNFYVSI